MKKITPILILLSLISGFCRAEIPQICISDSGFAEENATYIVELEDSLYDPYAPSLFGVCETADTVMEDLCGESDTIKPGFVYSEAINGFSVTANEADIEKILNTPGVKAVHKSTKLSIIEPLTEDASDITEVTYLHKEDFSGYTGAGEVIAIIDNEFDTTHEFFAAMPEKPRLSQVDINRIIASDSSFSAIDASKVYLSEKIPFAYDYGQSDYTLRNNTGSHGTHVAGIAAGKNASPDENEPLSGVAPDAQLVLMKVSTSSSDVDLSSAIKAIDHAILLGATAINISFGMHYNSPASNYPLSLAISNARKQGIAVCCAAGNLSRGYTYSSTQAPLYTGNIDYSSLATPAAYSDSTAVASSDKNSDRPSSYTSWGVSETLELKPDISVPGRDIKSAVNDNKYDTKRGTSMASPHMSGITALISQYLKTTRISYTDEEKITLINNLVMSTADVLKTTENIPYSPRQQGAGRANVRKATETSVFLKGNTGNTKISLGEISDNTFTLNFSAVNLSDTDITFTPAVDVTCDTCSNGKILTAPARVPVSVNAAERITVPANSETQVKISVTVNPDFINRYESLFENGFFIDGFVYLRHDTKPSVNIPFTGFYGNWSLQSVFDKSVYDDGGSLLRIKNYGGTYLYSTRSVSGASKQFVLGEYITASGTAYDKKYCAISPNNDGDFEGLGFSIQTMRPSRECRTFIQVPSGKIYSLHNITEVTNKYAILATTISGFENVSNFPEGDYAFITTGIFNYDGAEKYRSELSMPFMLDRTAPKISRAALSNNILTLEAYDNHFIRTMQISYKDASGNKKADISVSPDTLKKDRGDTVTASFTLDNPDPESIVITCYDYAYNYSKTNYSDIYTATVMGDTLAYRITGLSGGEAVFAFYDAGGKLVCIKTADIQAHSSVTSGVIEITEDISSATDCKILIWDSLSGAAPVSESIQFKVNEYTDL